MAHEHFDVYVNRHLLYTRRPVYSKFLEVGKKLIEHRYIINVKIIKFFNSLLIYIGFEKIVAHSDAGWMAAHSRAQLLALYYLSPTSPNHFST